MNPLQSSEPCNRLTVKVCNCARCGKELCKDLNCCIRYGYMKLSGRIQDGERHKPFCGPCLKKEQAAEVAKNTDLDGLVERGRMLRMQDIEQDIRHRGGFDLRKSMYRKSKKQRRKADDITYFRQLPKSRGD